MYILQTFAVLAFIGLLAWVLIKFVAPRLPGNLPSGKMKIIEKLNLEPGRSIYLVEVENRKLLIGCASNAVSFLKEIKSPENTHLPDDANFKIGDNKNKDPESSTKGTND